MTSQRLVITWIYLDSDAAFCHSLFFFRYGSTKCSLTYSRSTDLCFFGVCLCNWFFFLRGVLGSLTGFGAGAGVPKFFFFFSRSSLRKVAWLFAIRIVIVKWSEMKLRYAWQKTGWSMLPKMWSRFLFCFVVISCKRSSRWPLITSIILRWGGSLGFKLRSPIRTAEPTVFSFNQRASLFTGVDLM